MAGYNFAPWLAAARTYQQLVGPLAPNPQLQPLVRLINLMPVNLVARPPQYPRPIVIPHRKKNSRFWPSSKTREKQDGLQIPAQSHKIHLRRDHFA
jgi:hypothetical protein